MRTVKIGELKNQLSGFLQSVRNGEEIVICDRNAPIARIVPFHSGSDHEARLVASGAMKMPEEETDWGEFYLVPTGSVPRELAIQVAMDSRGDR